MMKIERYSYYRNYKGGLRKIRLPNVVDRERERIEAVTCWRWFVPMMAGLFSVSFFLVAVLLQWRIGWLYLLLPILALGFFVYSNEEYAIWKKIFF